MSTHFEPEQFSVTVIAEWNTTLRVCTVCYHNSPRYLSRVACHQGVGKTGPARSKQFDDARSRHLGSEDAGTDSALKDCPLRYRVGG